MECLIINCNKKVWWRGYCSLHGQRLKFHGDPLYQPKRLHHKTKTPEYKTWCHMRERCNNKKDKSYFRYGGRGISVCKEWEDSFMEFYECMGDKPTPKHQLDRINNDGNYEPSNCRWATPRQQSNNRRSCTYYTYQGKTMTLAEWARYVGMNSDKLRQRVRRYKWSIEKALTT